MKTWTVIFPPDGEYLGTDTPLFRNELGDCYDLRGAALLTHKEALHAAATFEDGFANRLSARTAKRLPGNRPALSRRQRLKSKRHWKRKFEAKRRLDYLAQQLVGRAMARSPLLMAMTSILGGPMDAILRNQSRCPVVILDEVAPMPPCPDILSVFSGRPSLFTSGEGQCIVDP